MKFFTYSFALLALALAPPVSALAQDDVIPYEVTDFSVKYDKAEGGFQISFTTPSKGYVYDYSTWQEVEKELTSLSKAVVSYRETEGYGNPWVPVKTIENPELNKTYSFIDKTAPKAKSLEFKAIVYNETGSQFSNAYNTVTAFGGVKPEKVTDCTVTTTLGQQPVTLKFKAPSKSIDGDDLDALDHIYIFSKYYDYSSYQYIEKEYGKVSPVTPGQDCSFILNDMALDDGENRALIRAVGPEGSSDDVEVNFYIGIDTPGKVENLTLTEQADGTYLISWDPPTKGQNNGYIGDKPLTYTVTKQGKSSTYPYPELTSGKTDCSYVYTPGETQESVKFVITAQNESGKGDPAETIETIMGPSLPLPYSETFSNQVNNYTVTSDNLWSFSHDTGDQYPASFYIAKITYADSGTTINPQGEGGFLYFRPYASTKNGKYSYNSSAIDVSTAEYVNLSFNYFNVGKSDMTIEAAIQFDNSEPLILKTIPLNETEPVEEWTTAVKGVFVPAGAKKAKIILSAIKAGEKPETIVFDDISLISADAPAKIYPASVSEFKAVYSKTDNTVTVTGKAPTLSHATLGDVHNQQLTYITCIKLYRRIGMGTDDVLIHTWTPRPGGDLEFVDDKITEFGEYSYKAITYVDQFCDYGQFLDEPVMVGQVPVDINDLTLTTNKGQAPVTVTFTVPDKANDGETLDKVTKVVVERYDSENIKWDLVKEITEGLVPGQKASCEDSDVTAGNVYQYKATVYGTAGGSLGTLGSVYVGADQPLTPTNVKAEVNSDGTVTITWEAPTAGVNNGYIDFENLTYTIQRGNGYSDYDATMLKAGVTGTTFTDETDFGDEEAVKYFVKATSAGVTGYSGISNVLIVGNPSKLPFTENFEAVWDNNISADHSTWTMQSSETSSVWAFAQLAYSIMDGQIVPQDGRGLAYAYYGPASTNERDDYLTSGNIDIAGVEHPVVEFWMYGIPDYDSTLALDVAFDRSDDFSEINKVDYRTVTEAGWTKISCPVTPPQDAKTMNIRFHAHKGEYSCSVIIDNIRVYEQTQDGLDNVSLGRLNVTTAGSTITVSGAGDSEVTVTNLAGITIARHSGDFSISVAPGTYIVSAPGHKGVKVAVGN